MKTTLKSASDIPAGWQRLLAVKKTLVMIRASNGAEHFKVDWQEGELVSDPEKDLIIMQDGTEYPCKIDIFKDTYESVGQGRFRKKGETVLAAIPEGEEAEIHTLEGVLPVVSYPDYVAIGKENEVWGVSKDYAEKNFEFKSN